MEIFLRKLIFLLPFISLAQDTCTISSKSIFIVEDQLEIEVYAIPQDGSDKIYSGKLSHTLIISREEDITPNSKLTHKYLIVSQDGKNSFEIVETIQLKGCNIEFVNTLSPNFEAKSKWGIDHATVYYLPIKTQNVNMPFLKQSN